MTEHNPFRDNGDEAEQYPVEPRYHPVNRLARQIYDSLASAKLAMLLLVSILISCLLGALLYKDDMTRQTVFGSLWFNGLLVLLVLNTACCFFGRMWKRRITVISFGMILFHLSFVAMFIAIVFNSLFSFNGILRLTEGETLSNRDPKSYDIASPGLFFSYSRLKGETTLQKVYRGYKVDGGDKKIAFDIVVAEGAAEKRGTVYVNNTFTYKGIDYIREQEGYSLLTIVNDRQGKELHGLYVPLQSYSQKDGSYIYGSGTRIAPGWFGFPPVNGTPLFNLQLEYLTDDRKDRNGTIRFKVWPLAKTGGAMHFSGGAQSGNPMAGAAPHSGGASGNPMNPHAGGDNRASDGGSAGGTSNAGAMHSASGAQMGNPLADGTVNVGEKLAFGEYQLVTPEVRYWVSMNVRYNPGKPFVLASLCVGLVGIIITTIGRLVKRRS